MSFPGFSKFDTQSDLNESPDKASYEADSFTACMQCIPNESRSEKFSSDKSNRKEMMMDKKTEVRETTLEKFNQEWDFPKGDDKPETKNFKEVSTNSTESIQNAHPSSSQENSHLLNFSTVDDIAAVITVVNRECKRSLPWSRTGGREQNLAVPMFLYLLYNDIKSEICDIDLKEWEACQAHKWGEALRLRGQKNELNLIREHQMLNAVGLKLEKNLRSTGIESIAKRQNVVDNRENLIFDDRNEYSKEAKDLYQKWEAEDDELGMNLSFVERAGLMNVLEKEWKILAYEDKKRISQFYVENKPVLLTDYHHQLTDYCHN